MNRPLILFAGIGLVAVAASSWLSSESTVAPPVEITQVTRTPRAPEGLSADRPEEPAERESVEVPAPTAEVETTQVTEPEGELAPQKGAVLEGRVVNDQGLPVAAAEVWVWNRSRPSGEPDLKVAATGSGHFSVPGVGPKFVAGAWAAGLTTKQGLRGTLAPGTPCQDLTLVLMEAVELVGTVVNPTGAPIEGARLQLGNALNTRSSQNGTAVPGVTTFGQLTGSLTGRVTTGANGQFAFEDVAAQWLNVRAEADGHVGRWLGHDPSEGEFTIVLNAGAAITGVVLDARGKPAAGAQVTYGPSLSNTSAASNRAQADKEGGFRFTGVDLEEGGTPSYVAAVLEGHAVELIQPAVLDDDSGQSNVLRLQRAVPLAGRVVDGEGRPVEGARLRLASPHRFERGYITTGSEPTWEGLFPGAELWSAKDGTFTFPHRRAGACRIRVNPPERREHFDFPVGASQGTVEITLTKERWTKVVLRGRALDRETGAPIRSFKVQPWIGNQAIGQTFDVEDGHFELSGLEAGQIGVALGAEGYAPLRLEDQLFEEGVHELGDLALDPACAMSVLVVDEAGEPWRDGSLRVLGRDGKPLQLRVGSVLTGGAMLTGKPVLIDDLPCRPLTVVVQRLGKAHEFQADPSTLKGETLTLTLALEVLETAPLAILLLDAKALGADGDSFVAEALAAIATRDRTWLEGNSERFLGTMVRQDLEVRVSLAGGNIAGGRLSWDREKQSFRSETMTRTGDSTSTGTSTDGAPFSGLTWREIPTGQLEIEVLVEGELVESVSFELQPSTEGSQGPPLVIVI